MIIGDRWTDRSKSLAYRQTQATCFAYEPRTYRDGHVSDTQWGERGVLFLRVRKWCLSFLCSLDACFAWRGRGRGRHILLSLFSLHECKRELTACFACMGRGEYNAWRVCCLFFLCSLDACFAWRGWEKGRTHTAFPTLAAWTQKGNTLRALYGYMACFVSGEREHTAVCFFGECVIRYE